MDYSLCVSNGKNYAAIEKIIAELSMQDYLRMNPRRKDGRPKHRFVPYSLSAETQEALEVKHDYLSGRISEEEYKSYCLKYNLRRNLK